MWVEEHKKCQKLCTTLTLVPKVFTISLKYQIEKKKKLLLKYQRTKNIMWPFSLKILYDFIYYLKTPIHVPF